MNDHIYTCDWPMGPGCICPRDPVTGEVVVDRSEADELRAKIERVEALYEEMARPRPGDHVLIASFAHRLRQALDGDRWREGLEG